MDDIEAALDEVGRAIARLGWALTVEMTGPGQLFTANVGGTRGLTSEPRATVGDALLDLALQLRADWRTT